ncbi:MAG TPA: hypothetical protein VNK95_04575 [Caldilineaceae bacterium]|nr:hypothetical protein [Caldilineaceae bacterium]
MMPRPYILSHNDKWFVFLGCTLVALCTSKEEALVVQREWIRRSQSLASGEEMTVGALPERAPAVMENGNA